MQLLWWFPIHVSTSIPVSDLKNCRSRISWSMNPGTTSACDESPDLGLKNILLFENIAICLALHFLMSCKTVSLAVLHTFYPVCMNTGQRHVTAAGTERSQMVQSSNRFSIIQTLTCCLFLKAMPLLHKIKLLPTEPQKLHSFTTTDPEFFKCNTKLWA